MYENWTDAHADNSSNNGRKPAEVNQAPPQATTTTRFIGTHHCSVSVCVELSRGNASVKFYDESRGRGDLKRPQQQQQQVLLHQCELADVSGPFVPVILVCGDADVRTR